MQKHYKTKPTHRHHPVFTGIHIGAVALLSLGLFGLAEVTKYESNWQQASKSHESEGAPEDRADGKKTLRMPVKYDDGLRPATISGS